MCCKYSNDSTIFTKACTEYYGSRKVDGNETKIYVYCKRYHLDEDRRQEIQPEYCDKNIRLNVLPSLGIHMVTLTVVDDT